MFKSPIFKRFLKRKSSIFGLIILTIYIITVIIGPSLCSYDPIKQNTKMIHKGPSAEHWCGTDYLGRDTFTRRPVRL